jgi:transcriptional regulator with XRE-family HTH domain
MSRGDVTIYSFIDIGNRLRELRGSLRQADLAKEFNVDRTYISNMELGRSKPSLDYLMFISTKFNASVDWILTGEGDILKKTNKTGGPYKSGEQILIIRNQKLDKYIRSLLKLWTEGAPDIKGWIIVQLEKAFPDIAAEIKKTKGDVP